MVDRPMIFSGPMVARLLDGSKTQTRRLLKLSAAANPHGTTIPSYYDRAQVGRLFGAMLSTVGKGSVLAPIKCKVGDRIWVRESVACGACAPSKPSYWAPSFWRREQGTPRNPNGLWYRADGLEPEKQITERGKWRPAIHMPRWASRITLTITEVRVERLNGISEEDAIAEGIYSGPIQMRDGSSVDCWFGLPHVGDHTPVDAYGTLWESLHNPQGYCAEDEPKGWAANPWVVAVSFTVTLANIDSLPKSEAA